MFHLLKIILLQTFTWTSAMSTVTAIVAILVSITAMRINRTMARRNIRLSIQQAIFKIVSEKAKDCNTIWENETIKSLNDKFPHYKVVSELVISKEVIDKSFELFKKNYKLISEFQDDYYYLLWKQLRTDLRNFIIKAPESLEQINNAYFSEQISDLHLIFKKHFEPVK